MQRDALPSQHAGWYANAVESMCSAHVLPWSKGAGGWGVKGKGSGGWGGVGKEAVAESGEGAVCGPFLVVLSVSLWRSTAHDPPPTRGREAADAGWDEGGEHTRAGGRVEGQPLRLVLGSNRCSCHSPCVLCVLRVPCVPCCVPCTPRVLCMLFAGQAWLVCPRTCTSHWLTFALLDAHATRVPPLVCPHAREMQTGAIARALGASVGKWSGAY